MLDGSRAPKARLATLASDATSRDADAPSFLPGVQEIHGNRWALVAAELPGKTGQQCAQRWRHKVNPAIKKEKWTPEEDAQVRTREPRIEPCPRETRARRARVAGMRDARVFPARIRVARRAARRLPPACVARTPVNQQQTWRRETRDDESAVHG